MGSCRSEGPDPKPWQITSPMAVAISKCRPVAFYSNFQLLALGGNAGNGFASSFANRLRYNFQFHSFLSHDRIAAAVFTLVGSTQARWIRQVCSVFVKRGQRRQFSAVKTYDCVVSSCHGIGCTFCALFWSLSFSSYQ